MCSNAWCSPIATWRCAARACWSSSASCAGASRGRGEVDPQSAFAGLMFQLLMTQPKAPDEPAPESEEWREKWVGAAAGQGADRWVSMVSEQATTKARKAIESSIRFYGLGVEA